jgi:hypothetical protein
MTYRSIPGMEVHLYRKAELTRTLHHAGFVVEEMIPIDAVNAKPIRGTWLLPGIRAGGWVVFARRPL